MQRSLLVLTVLVSLGLAAAVRAEQMPNAPPVTAKQVAEADTASGNWITMGQDYGAHRFSTLASIDRNSVTGLHVAWKRTLGDPVSLEGTPSVNGGVMYVTTGKDAVYALDAKTGSQIWKYTYPLPDKAGGEACCNYNNRGVTLVGNNVITATLDAHLIALDARTGKLVWNATVAPYMKGYSITSPPLLVKNMLLTGVAGGEYGIRGFVAAFDATSGKPLWKTYTIPAPGQPGSETWKTPGSIGRAGGPSWIQGTYDPGLNTVYWGVGNPTPLWDARANSGTLLYTDSMIALDANTGKVKWHFQYTPHDIWDYDGVNEATIVDLPMNGKIVKAVAQANRNGHLYVLDRTNGKLIYAEPFVDKVNFGKVNRTTGVLTPNPEMQRTAMAEKPFLACPGNMGGKNWEPTSYDPTKHRLFIPIIESCDQIIPKPQKFVRGNMDLGGGLNMKAYMVHGSVAAIDLPTGKILWKTHFRSPQDGGTLTTAGGLVFTSDPEGKLRALNTDTGRELWNYHTVSGASGPAMTYSEDGQQYVAVMSSNGGAWSAFFVDSTPWLKSVPDAAELYVFKIGKQTAAR